MLPTAVIKNLTFGEAMKGFLLLVALSAAVSYFIHYATKSRYLIPGDFFRVKAPSIIYIPFGSTLLISAVLFLVLTSKLLTFIIGIALVYIAYRFVFKGGIF